MGETRNTGDHPAGERRGRNDTFPWRALNLLLFPAPAHFTLLRVRDHTFGGSLRHIGVTFLLVAVLLAAAGLQVLFPAIGPWWMLMPILSGVVLLWRTRSLKDDFKSPPPLSDLRSQSVSLIFLAALLTGITLLPGLDLIELAPDTTPRHEIWIGHLPRWQEIVILSAGFLLLVGGYAVNEGGPVSLGRIILLYALFLVLANLVMIPLIVAYGWLKVRGGFLSQSTAILVAAVLALDYRNAERIGQYARRFFFLTLPKGFYFLFLWLCLFGLPQKAASTYAVHRFDQVRPVSGIPPRHLIVTERGGYGSAHRVQRRLRSLYARALIAPGTGGFDGFDDLFGGPRGVTLPEDTDVRRLPDPAEGGGRPASMDFDRTPLFRPIHPEWDVMLTALLAQEMVAEADLDRLVAGFKNRLPATSGGRLPEIDAPHKAGYLSLAAGVRVDYLPPRLDLAARLWEKGFHPVFPLRLDGKTRWAALLHLDREAGLGWFRMEIPTEMQSAIQRLFDGGEASASRHEILSRTLVPLSLDHLSDILDHLPGPAVIFSREGLEGVLPGTLTGAGLAAMRRGVDVAADPLNPAPEKARGETGGPLSDEARYLETVAAAKALLAPVPLDADPFFEPTHPLQPVKGVARLWAVETLLKGVSPLKDGDRIDIARLLVRHRHTAAAPGLFHDLAARPPVSSDLLDCGDALMIGRRLFLLGHHGPAAWYLETAFRRHPYFSEYEMWRHICRAKRGEGPVPFLSPPALQPVLYRYYRTLTDIRNGHEGRAKRRLEAALARDSHDSLSHHLLERYFDRPLDERYFFPTPEGL